jgi:hypothetical protein
MNWVHTEEISESILNQVEDELNHCSNVSLHADDENRRQDSDKMVCVDEQCCRTSKGEQRD